METKPKNRAWVKDAAIVFLVVLLLLTFFSNTIMNHSLPEVATQMVTDGTITAKVRGTGTVAANGDHKVKAKSNVTIGKVMVKAGQEVNAGDVLFILGAGDSAEIEEARAALEDLQTNYAQAALNVPLADAFTAERNAINQAERAMKKAQQAYDDAKKKADKLAAENSEKIQKILEEKSVLEENLTIARQSLTAQQSILDKINGEVAAAEKRYNELYAQWKLQVSFPEETPGGTGTSTPDNGGGDPGQTVNAEAPTSTATPSTAPTSTATPSTAPASTATPSTAPTSTASPSTAPTAAVTPSSTPSEAPAPTAETLQRPLTDVGAQANDQNPVTEEQVNAAKQQWEALKGQAAKLNEELIAALKGADGTDLQPSAARYLYITQLTYKIEELNLQLKAKEAELKSYGVNTDELSRLYEEKLLAQEEYNAKLDALNKAAASQERSIASASVGLSAISNQIKRQQEKIKQLTGEGEANTITANVSGTVTEVNCTSGDSVIKDDILCAIEVPDMGYTVSFSVTNDQARRLHVGDTATISNYYWGEKIVATLSTIQTDKKNPMTNKTLTFDLEGDVTSGSELTVSVGQKSARYDLIIPNSAIRTDSNGSFVLAVVAKNSPLGNRYIAKRVAIEVLAADDTNSAVTADLNNGDYVITTSSAPIATGDMVRMADSQA